MAPAHLFWPDLAQDFRALHNRYPDLRADWHYRLKSGGPGEWRVTGAGSETAVAQFEALARRGGARLPNPHGLELHINWMNHMRLRSDRFRFGRDDGFEQNADGSGRADLIEGTILHVSEAAADFCLALEGDALEAGRRDESRPVPSGSTGASPLTPDSPQPEFQVNSPAVAQTGSAGKRGRRRNVERRNAIQRAVAKHADEWRDHLSEIFDDLDNEDVPMDDFYGREIDIGDGHIQVARKWQDLDLARGKEREKVIDGLRWYFAGRG